MLKSLTLLSVSAATLLATTQAYSHVLCAPNDPQLHVKHSHNQAYTVPRIQPIASHTVSRTVQGNPNQQQHLQAQRARQQQALANQRRINQQRRAQAQQIQQQVAARKAQQIQQQQAAAQQARAARQQAAQQAARSRAQVQRQQVQQVVYQPPAVQQPQRVVYRQPAPQVVYQQPAQQVVYTQPAPQVTYIQAPAPVYVAPVTTYVPARTSVSFQINANRGYSHARRHIRRVNRQRQVLRYPRQRGYGRVAQKRYQARPNAQRNYRWNNRTQRHQQWKHNRQNNKNWRK